MINKIGSILLNIPMLPQEARNWIEERLIFEEKLSEQEQKDWFELANFLIRYPELKNKEKEQLTPEDNQLLDSVEKILNDLLKRLKEIKGE
ncbi:hypothetical protein [Planktothrix agardhii]|jgi:hypothetical protein|nr:hypothetical protein [Planktothrix agardhii]